MKKLLTIALILGWVSLASAFTYETPAGGVQEGSDVTFGEIITTMPDANTMILESNNDGGNAKASIDFKSDGVRKATIGTDPNTGQDLFLKGSNANITNFKMYSNGQIDFDFVDSQEIHFNSKTSGGSTSVTDILVINGDGTIDIIGKVNIDTNGNITTTGSINAAIKTYANISNTADQTFASTGTGYAILFNSNDNLVGITHSTSTDTENITIVTSGVYSINAQPQVTAGAAGDFHMWLQVDTGGGFADVTNSNVKLALAINNEGVIPLTLTLPLDAGDTVRLMGSVSNTGVILDATTPGGEPVIPAIICTIFKI
jgi:hypothetical protein